MSMAEVATACIEPVFEIGKCLWAPIAKRINYVRNLSKNQEMLCEKASDLRDKRDDVVTKIDRLKLEKTPTKECDTLIKKVEEMENKVKTIVQELGVEKKCIGLFPDIFARVELGERVMDMISDINVLLDKFKSGNEFLVDSPPPRVEKKPDPTSKLAACAYRTLDKVLNKIRDKSTPKIGIWGMGGVGKTTVLELLNNSPDVKTMFDFVILVTVSKSWSIRKLQKAVGDRVQINIDGLSHDRVVSKLLEGLEGKKYLLLLDDVWDVVDLSVLVPNANQENGCKVVLTTRNREVCRKMKIDEVPLAVLPDEEAWEMFNLEVEHVASLPTIRPYADDIVKQCAGLPLALKVVSGMLRKEENVNIWRNLLRELRSPATSIIEDMNENVFKILKVSYDQLNNKEKKQCLLFCGLYPEDSQIEKFELIEYLRAEGILPRELTFAEALDKGDAILQALIDASLLENCDDDDSVKMHDVVRDLVLAMTSPKGEEPQQLVRAGISSGKIPDAMEWKKATRISFIMNNDLRNLPESPDCPRLLTLFLQESDNLEEIPETFFSNMPDLRVLDLSVTGIKSLPTSISKLDGLRELVLSHCRSLKALPAGAICKLSQMEVFKLLDTQLSDESQEIVAKELSNLSSLSWFEFDFGTVGNLQHFLENSISWKQRRLTKFYFCINANLPYVRRSGNRCLCYGGGGGGGEEEERGSSLPSAIEDVLIQSDGFELIGHGKLSTFSEVGVRNICELKWCFIEECDALEKIVDRNGLEMGAFPNLEHLSLVRLSNLKTILCLEMEEGPLLPPPPNANTFTNLKSLFLSGCPSIEQLFSSGFMVQQLSNLEDLYVHSCRGLKGMIPDDQKLDYESLPKLRRLWLVNLPEFDSFIKGVPMSWQSLKEVSIRSCPKLKKLPFDTNGAPNLEKIDGSQIWWDALEWDNDAIRLQFQPRFDMSRFDP